MDTHIAILTWSSEPPAVPRTRPGRYAW